MKKKMISMKKEKKNIQIPKIKIQKNQNNLILRINNKNKKINKKKINNLNKMKAIETQI